MLLGTANVMEGVVNWTILIGNRAAAHGSLQAALPAIRRIVACLPQHHSELAGLAIKTWSAGTEPSPKTLGASGSLWDTYGRAHRAASGRLCRIPNTCQNRPQSENLVKTRSVRTVFRKASQTVQSLGVISRYMRSADISAV